MYAEKWVGLASARRVLDMCSFENAQGSPALEGCLICVRSKTRGPRRACRLRSKGDWFVCV